MSDTLESAKGDIYWCERELRLIVVGEFTALLEGLSRMKPRADNPASRRICSDRARLD